MTDDNCARCASKPAPFTIRTERLCSECFGNYVGSKAEKHLYQYRFGRDQVKALLALSLGPSSAALLHVLDRHLQRQMSKLGKCAYELHVLHVSEDTSSTTLMTDLQTMYPKHSYRTVQLSQDCLGNSEPVDDEEQRLLPSLTTSARSDLTQKALYRLIVKHAQELSCSSILFGDSMTRLSEKTLAETANGRGFAVAQMLGEAATIHEMPCRYPVRDLFRPELEQYTQHFAPMLWDLTCHLATGKEGSTRQPVSSKELSIDKLMAQYVAGVGKQYPNIVANVVRTGARLTKLSDPKNARCEICGFSFPYETSEQRPRPGDVPNDSLDPDLRHMRCHGCLRSMSDKP